VSVRHAKGPDLVQHMVSTRKSPTWPCNRLAMARIGVGIAVVSVPGASHRDATDLRFVPPCPTVQRDVCAGAPLGKVWV